jgi:hypothetical protein
MLQGDGSIDANTLDDNGEKGNDDDRKKVDKLLGIPAAEVW